MGNTIEREEGVENIVVRVSDQAINGQDKSGRKIDGLIMCVNGLLRATRTLRIDHIA